MSLLLLFSNCARPLLEPAPEPPAAMISTPAPPATAEKPSSPAGEWTFVGALSPTEPTVVRLLTAFLGNEKTALIVIRANQEQYSPDFYRTLPIGAAIFLSDRQELRIDPEGSLPPPNTVTPLSHSDAPAPEAKSTAISRPAIAEEVLAE